MPVLGGPEGAVKSLVATLASSLNAGLDAIWATAGNTYVDGARTLSVPNIHPVRILPFWRATWAEFPVVMVYANGFHYDPGNEGVWNTIYSDATVEWYVMGDSDVATQIQCSRY